MALWFTTQVMPASAKNQFINKKILGRVTDVISHCRTFETLKIWRSTLKFGCLQNVITVARVDEYAPLDLASTVREIFWKELTQHARLMPYEATPAAPPSRNPLSVAAAGVDDIYTPLSPPRSQHSTCPLPKQEDRFSYLCQPANTYYDPNEDVSVSPPRQRNAFQKYNAYCQASVC